MFATLAALIGPYIIAFITQLVLGLSNIALGIATWFLEYTLSDNFIRISYTQMTGDYANPIIGIGWPLLRDLVNMGFLVMIIFIGIATSLRIQDYQAQKTLLPLLMIAFLINFSPVIIGVIVDASNILMNFFIDDVAGFKMMQSRFVAQGAIIQNATRGSWNPLAMINLSFQSIMMTVFNFVSATIYTIFAFLFIVRRIAIWILVILSPVAFASYVFPATRSYFQSWWRQLFQWCFIGVTAGFFLYLSNQLMMNTDVLRISAPPGAGMIESFVALTIPGMVSTAFLMFGLMYGFSTSAMGAGAVISFTKNNAKKLGNWSRTKATSAVRGIPIVSRAEGAIMRRAEALPLVGGAFGGRGAYSARLRGSASASMKKIEQIALDPGGVKEIEKIATSAGTSADKVAAIQYLAGKGKLPGTTAVRDDVNRMKKLGHDMSAAYDSHPSWKGSAAELTKAEKNAGMTLTEKQNKETTDQVSNMSPSKILDLDADEFNNKAVVAGLNDRKASQLLNNGAQQEMANINRTITAMTGLASPFSSGYPAGGKTSEISNDLINYISTQQTAGKWPH
ncbi:MAG: hypothetical protein V1905_00570 [bacterium]